MAVRPRFGAVWRPKCRPPRRKTPKLGCRRRGGLRYGHNGVKSRVLWRLVEAASFRVVACWFSACCGVMPPRARWGRRVLYQWTQAAVLRVGFQSGWFPSNVARNSRAHISDIEMWSLELQRLWPISKNDRVKLRATFAGVITVVTFWPLYSPGNRDLACRCALHRDRQDSPPVQRS